MDEQRTEQIMTHTTRTLKRAVRIRAAEEECTVSEWMHQLLERELGPDSADGKANGAASDADAVSAR